MKKINKNKKFSFNNKNAKFSYLDVSELKIDYNECLNSISENKGLIKICQALEKD